MSLPGNRTHTGSGHDCSFSHRCNGNDTTKSTFLQSFRGAKAGIRGYYSMECFCWIVCVVQCLFGLQSPRQLPQRKHIPSLLARLFTEFLLQNFLITDLFKSLIDLNAYTQTQAKANVKRLLSH